MSHSFVLLQLLPLLASSLEFGSAAAPALTALLKMGSWLSTEEFSAKVNSLSWFFSLILFCSSNVNIFFSSNFCLLDLLLLSGTDLVLVYYFLFTWVWPLWCLGFAYDCEIVCLQWSSYQNWTPATYWSIWWIIVIPNGWWTGMKLENYCMFHPYMKKLGNFRLSMKSLFLVKKKNNYFLHNILVGNSYLGGIFVGFPYILLFFLDERRFYKIIIIKEIIETSLFWWEGNGLDEY